MTDDKSKTDALDREGINGTNRGHSGWQLLRRSERCTQRQTSQILHKSSCYFRSVMASAIVAANMQSVVSHPSTFNGLVLIHRPMILRFDVISMISSIKNGVEIPCTTEDQTRAFMGLKPMKLRPTASAVKTAIERLNRLTSPGGEWRPYFHPID